MVCKISMYFRLGRFGFRKVGNTHHTTSIGLRLTTVVYRRVCVWIDIIRSDNEVGRVGTVPDSCTITTHVDG